MVKNTKELKRSIRKKRIRAKISGTIARPRISVFRSLKHTYAQIIDDENGKTIVGVSDKEIKSGGKKGDRAFELGRLLAQKAKEKKIEKVIFDKSGYKYHGRTKALADGAREGGLKF